jgi:hypothetical protein
MLGHSRLSAGFYVESVASRGARLGGAGRGGTRGDDEKRMPRTIGRWLVAGALDQADVETLTPRRGTTGCLPTMASAKPGPQSAAGSAPACGNRSTCRRRPATCAGGRNGVTVPR